VAAKGRGRLKARFEADVGTNTNVLVILKALFHKVVVPREANLLENPGCHSHVNVAISGSRDKILDCMGSIILRLIDRFTY